MNIAFDSIALLGPMSKNSGIGNYVLSQFKTILHQDKENQYFFFNIFGNTNIFSEEVQSGLLKENDFMCVHKDGKFFYTPGFLDFYGELIRTYIKKNKIDIFYITSPFEKNVPTYKREWFEEVRVIITVYDIIPYIFKDHYLSDQSAIDWYMNCVDMLRWADRLVVISKKVKDDLIELLNFDEDRIDVIWGAPDSEFNIINISKHEKDKLFKKYNIDSPFVMCTCGDHEREKISGLISAYGKLSEELHRKYQLVIVCKLEIAVIDRFQKLAKDYGVKNNVIFTNFISDEELSQLYNLATLVAFPSIYERFGFSIFETWACGTPVLTSCDSGLDRIAEDSAILVDSNSIDSITDGLTYALTECDLEELAKRGKKSLNPFTWDNVIKATINAFNKTIRKQDIEITDTESAKSKIAFFTPLPPIQSGISDYSVDIIQALKDYFDIDIFIDDGYIPNCDLSQNVRIFNYRDYKKMKHKYLTSIFQIGNNTYHIYMWPYVQGEKGIIELHDYNLHGVVNYESFSRIPNYKRYKRYLREDYSEKVIDHIIDTNEPDYNYTVNSFLINYADKIIVHSKEAKRKLLEKDIRRQVYFIHHYANINSLSDRKSSRKKTGLPENSFVFCAFGHIQETKRAIPIIKAFSKIISRYGNIRLVFVGKLAPHFEEEFQREILINCLQKSVSVTGFTKLEEFNTYIDASDICLNLRWPYNGETSGSLMRILAAGKAVIVNDIGSFSEIPNDACFKLPSAEGMKPDEEVDYIADAMEQLILNESLRNKLKKNARKYAEEYLDIRKIALQYINIILSDSKYGSCLTNQLLRDLHKEILLFDKEEFDRVSYTLSYICPKQ